MGKSEKLSLPNHIAIIMDGNGRWAQKRGLLRHVGHEQGAKTLEDIIRYVSELGVKFLTLYVFSSENWQRPKEEVDAVMAILERYLRNDVNDLIKNDIKINSIGDLSRLPWALKNTIIDVINKTAHCKKLVISLALSYGAWEEMVMAVNNIVKDSKDGDISVINEKIIRKYLYTDNLPDPDLFIRTGGELRLSNFLLMQISYSELYFSKTLWPDFRRNDLDQALRSFANRERRYGSVAL